MKKYLLVTGILLAVLKVSAQNATPPAPRGSSYQDSVRSNNARAGKIVVVDGVPMNSAMDFIENLTPSKTHTVFLEAVRAASLVGTFKSRGPLTLFVPSDTGFKKRLGARLDTLIKSAHKYELINLLTYHAVSGMYNAKQLAKEIKAGKGEATLLTLSGSKLIVRIDSNRNIILLDETGGQTVISQFDISQSNGIMHLTTGVLVPKDKAL